MRRQLTLFLPAEQRTTVEPVRQRLDPGQHAIIPAHVTLCRDEELVPWAQIEQRLALLRDVEITMQFGEPQVLVDGCVLLRPVHGIEAYQQLRRSILGDDAGAHGAHITILHPRNAEGVLYDLNDLKQELSGLIATFHGFALIEQDGSGPWQVRKEFGIPVREGAPAR